MKLLLEWWDVCLYFVLGLVHILAWLSVPAYTGSLSADERTLSAASIGAACSAGITAVSILIPACMLILQMGLDKPLPPGAPGNIVRAMGWYVVSMVFGLFVLFVVPMRVAKSRVSHAHIVGVPFGLQLIAILPGTIWLLVTVLDIVRRMGAKP